ncbi:CGNR zinc finger domain-containing protein [Streptomyces erythrochromogenes]|uniref:CGNR zinc finger domain-containing protein n=1 Tax=Streptomyces erythrochromogenes TaxID=285574 RepID=UPI003633D8A8
MDIPPPAAGEELSTSLALVNTRFRLPGGPYEGLAHPSAARAWLTGHGLAPAGPTLDSAQTARLRELRETLRALFGARIGGTAADPGQVAAVNAVLAGCPPLRLLDWGAGEPVRVLRPGPSQPLEHALALLAEDGIGLLTGEHAGKLAACGTPGCTRLMLRSHAARRWCSTRCGNRIRAVRHAAAKSMRKPTHQ